jgi:hypothetical protein
VPQFAEAEDPAVASFGLVEPQAVPVVVVETRTVTGSGSGLGPAGSIVEEAGLVAVVVPGATEVLGKVSGAGVGRHQVSVAADDEGHSDLVDTGAPT